MSEKNNESKMDVLAALIAVALIVATFAALVLVANSRSVGTISVEGDVRRGVEQTVVYENDKIKQGQTVNWYVNNEKVATSAYENGAQLKFVPQAEGTTVIKAVSGKYNKFLTIDVQKPLLKISAKNVTAIYGEQPFFDYEISGLLEGDTVEDLNCNVHCTSEHSGCGIFEISAQCDGCSTYDVECTNGILTVLPKQLHISTQIVKTYDGKTAVDCPTLQLEGVLEGDEVEVFADKLYFESKNAGVCKLVTANLQLGGKDCANYVISDSWEGVILPKTLQLDGLEICDKTYDGTVKAQIEKMGKLKGVVDGDSVAIGELDVSFHAAETGKQKIDVKNIVLVGADKDNYVVQCPNKCEAEILAK